jgi:hypothetical protein
MSAALAPPPAQPPTPLAEIERAIADLRVGAERLARSSLADRIGWARACVATTAAEAGGWVEIACRAKRIPQGAAARAEEILAGPVAVVRHLQLLAATLGDVLSHGAPRLPFPPRVVGGQIRVAAFPTRSLYDAATFRPLHAETWLEPGVAADRLFGDAPQRLARRMEIAPRVALVLGAGNVSAIPASDALTHLFQNDCAVLLKMNPVNDYLGPHLGRALAPLVAAGLLRIAYGGPAEGRFAAQHPHVDAVHVTGSTATHDAVVWGASAEEQARRRAAGTPLLDKPVTSELGNVTPWAVVPGRYREGQLLAQAENIAASIANNASFNCIATKMLVTARGWPQRERFLDLVESALRRIPARHAYYPGAAARFAEFAGFAPPKDVAGRLPWVLRRDVDPQREPALFARESFVGVCGETALEADSPDAFLERAAEFMNERTWGTLAAAVTAPDDFARGRGDAVEAALAALRYGTVGVNLWPGVAYALASPPWGAYPGAPLSDVRSGRGHVHNTYLLERPQKTILRGPLKLFPKPVWFSSHRCAEQLAWRLFRLYCRPSLARLPGVFAAALRG